MVLSLGALLGNLGLETIRTALAEVRPRQVWHWCRKHLGPTVPSVPAKTRNALAKEQEPPPLPTESG